MQVKGCDHEVFSKLKNAYYHSEVIEFTNWLEIDEKDLKVRYAILAKIELLIKKHIKEAETYMFGSTANRLALPGSDIDVLVCVPNVTCSFTYNLVYETVLQILIGSK